MRLAIVAAGFTPGEADQLRRAMGAWRKQGVIDSFHRKLVDGMLHNGYSTEFAERLFQQIRGFGEYGFPESHAASFALLVYASAWLKHYYPAAFTAALLNSQPMGFYAPAQLVANARRQGVEVLPVDVNHSDWDCTLEAIQVLRLGFRQIQGLSASMAERIATARAARPFTSWGDFARRTQLPRPVLGRLARADAFQSLASPRRTSLWQALDDPEIPALFATADDDESPADLPPMSEAEEVVADYRSLGLSLRAHPVSFLRADLQDRGILPAESLRGRRHGERVTVAGIVLMRQRPSSASGVTFVTLEDETGFVNLIIHLGVWEKHHSIARTATLLQAQGTLQIQDEIIHVVVNRLGDLSELLRQLPTHSRDFR